MSRRISFLLSLAALPACGPVVEDDARAPDGGDPKKLDASCQDAFATLYGCYSTENESGYSDDELEMYLGELCSDYAAELDPYGDVCKGAMEEVLACLATLSCDEIAQAEDGDANLPEGCLDVYRDANQRCPEVVGFCNGNISGFDGGNSCGETRSGCLDGNEYGYDCQGGDDQVSCTCSQNGTDTTTVSVDATCGVETFGATVGAACGFPDGVFS